MRTYQVNDIIRHTGKFLSSCGWYTNVPVDGRVTAIRERHLGVEWSDGSTSYICPDNVELVRAAPPVTEATCWYLYTDETGVESEPYATEHAALQAAVLSWRKGTDGIAVWCHYVSDGANVLCARITDVGRVKSY